MNTSVLSDLRPVGRGGGPGRWVSSDFVDAGLVLPRALRCGDDPPERRAGPDLPDTWTPPVPQARPDPRASHLATPVLAHLDREGITAALLQPARPDGWRAVLDTAAAAPGRLRAVLPLPADGLPAALPLMAGHGLAGVTVSHATGLPAREAWRPFLLRLAAFGLHLHLDVDPDAWEELLPLVLGNGAVVRLELPRAAERLCRAWRAFRMLERHAAHPDLWICFSPAPLHLRGLGRLLDRLQEIAGGQRLAWCSGSHAGRRAYSSNEHRLALQHLLPETGVRDAVCGGNARALAFAGGAHAWTAGAGERP